MAVSHRVIVVALAINVEFVELVHMSPTPTRPLSQLYKPILSESLEFME